MCFLRAPRRVPAILIFALSHFGLTFSAAQVRVDGSGVQLPGGRSQAAPAARGSASGSRRPPLRLRVGRVPRRAMCGRVRADHFGVGAFGDVPPGAAEPAALAFSAVPLVSALGAAAGAGVAALGAAVPVAAGVVALVSVSVGLVSALGAAAGVAALVSVLVSAGLVSALGAAAGVAGLVSALGAVAAEPV